MMVPIPAGVPYDAKAGLKAARGSILQTVKGKVVKESPANLGGVPGTKTVAHGIVDGTKLEVSTWFAFDVKNHTVLGLFTLRELGAASDDVRVFISSRSSAPALPSSVLADDGIERTGFHNVEIAPAEATAPTCSTATVIRSCIRASRRLAPSMYRGRPGPTKRARPWPNRVRALTALS